MNKNTIEMNVTVGLEVKNCPVCFIFYAVPKELMVRKNKENGSWYCPNGHSLVFTKSELQQTREKLAQAQSDADYWKNRKAEVDRQNEILQRQNSAKKGQITKIKNRVANGVCPCCNRSFVNLHRHMKNQHPDFQKEEK